MTIKENQRKSLSVIKKSMFLKINVENVRFNKIKTNKIQCIKRNYRSLLQSMSRKKLTLYNLFFKKILVNKKQNYDVHDKKLLIIITILKN